MDNINIKLPCNAFVFTGSFRGPMAGDGFEIHNQKGVVYEYDPVSHYVKWRNMRGFDMPPVNINSVGFIVTTKDNDNDIQT